MRVSTLLRSLSVLALLAAIAAPEAWAQGQGRLRGRVLTDGTEEPIAGAAVRGELPGSTRPPVEALTDEDGAFQFIGLVSGAWEVSITAEGYYPTGGPVRVSAGNAVSTPPVDFYMSEELTALERALGSEALEGLDPVQIEADLAAADAAFNAQDYDGAIAGYQTLLDTLPQLTSLNVQIGSAYREQRNWDAALAAFDTALAADPGNSNIEAEIARTRLAMGDLEAAAGLAAAAGLNATREDLYNLGELEFAKGEVDAAADYYQKATIADPNWELPWFKLALVALNKGDMDTAKENFQKVVDLAPDSESGTQAQATLAALP